MQAAVGLDQGDYDQAADLLAESIALSRTLGDAVGEGIATVYLGRSKMSRGRIMEGAPDVARAVALVSEAGDRPAIAFAIFTPDWSRSSPASWKPPVTCSPAAPPRPPNSAWRR